MDPACEVKEKGTRGKNDGKKVIEEGTSPPPDLDPNEIIEADGETLTYAKEDWRDPEQIQVPMKMEPDLPFAMQTRQAKNHEELQPSRSRRHSRQERYRKFFWV